SLLAHGADPNARSSYTNQTCYESALLAGHSEAVQILLEHGASAVPLAGRDAFFAACARHDAAEAPRLLQGHREYLEHAQPLIDAASAGRRDTVELLLKLGMDPNREGVHGHRALHVAAADLSMCELLRAYGADPRSRCFGGTVQGWAQHAGNLHAARHHAEHSRSLLDAAASGHVALARELLEADPQCVREQSPGGDTALHELPADEDAAQQLIALLLAAGADSAARNRARQTPAEKLEARGLDQIADLLESAR
ncbi:MAG TPA: ankyrin repeat domain-containing protein, partial [Polyangiales bacterium]|nr:ankyrin repeat domain-containing protein [Polyangiales bacterium]